MQLEFQNPTGRSLRILCIGAHADDIEIGCGGTLIRLLSRHSDATVKWAVFSGSSERIAEAARSAEMYLGASSDSTTIFESFDDGRFPVQLREIKTAFERQLKSFEPDVIFTHYRDDRHQDHRLLSDVTWQTFRNHLILEYEVPKYDGDLGQPNLFFELDKEECDTKINRLNECFASQSGKHWFNAENFWAILRIRATECAAASGLAEAFHVRKAKMG